MAALHHGAAAAIHHRRLAPENTSLVKPVFFVSSFSTSFPAKHARRRNHLRQKILKTLKNPIFPKLPPASPIIPIESPSQEIKEFGINQEIQEYENSKLAEGEETQELKEVEVEVPAGFGIDGRIGVAGENSILKYGLWFAGAFVFQTVCAVLFFGLDEINNKRETENGSGELRVKDDVLDVNGDGKMGLRNSVIGDGFDNEDKLEMESKIEEIRLMAREVREKEKLQSKRNGEDGEGTDGGKYSKSEIEEEVDGTMVRVRKKLEKTRFTKPVVGHSSGETKRGDEVDKGDLLYKKKYKFKDFSFIGSVDSRVNGDMEEGNGVFRSGNGDDNAAGLGDEEKQTELSDGDPKGVDAVYVVEADNGKGMLETTEATGNTRSKVTKERGTSKQGKRKGLAKPKVVDGNASEKNNGGSALEPVKSRKQIVEAVKLGKSSDHDTAAVSNKLSKGNGTFRGKGFGNTKTAIKSKWWSNLPYVLVVFMQRGTGGEGLYTLKSSSSTEDRISYTVAFEDRADANNFCYLLESFFEDLGDFQADVVPLTVKELKEAEESYSLRAIVVKKGQLQLYAGQPLTDAEMALRSMIEQD